jgi:Domain of unknown function (DUF4190)
MNYPEYPANATTIPAPLPHAATMVAPPPMAAASNVGVSPRSPRDQGGAPHGGFTPARQPLPPSGPGNGYPGYRPPAPMQGPPPTDATTLATLSVVFAFVFAPVGVALGHLALARLRFSGQPGRDRALTGLFLSYLIIAIATLLLIVMAAVAATGDDSGRVSSPTGTTTTATTTSKAPTTTTPRRTPRTTTPAPATPTAVRVDDLRIGDCVRVEDTGPDPNRPGYKFIKLYWSPCTAGADVYRVDQLAAQAEACPDLFLVNSSQTAYACISELRR